MKKLIYTIIPILLVSFFIPQELDAQYRRGSKKIKHRFNAGAVVGVNMTQMDGDLYTGFDKVGLKVGAKASMFLTKKLDLVFELLYTQKGSRFENVFAGLSRRNKDRAIKLQYMEVPILLNVKFEEETENGYALEIGFSYGRLINYKVEEKVIAGQVSYGAMTSDYNNNEINGIIGLNYNFSNHFSLGIRTTVQLNLLYDNALYDEEPMNNPLGIDPLREVPFLRNFLLTFQAVYTIF